MNISKQSNRLQVYSAYLGNLFEHYDTALFGFLSPFLAVFLFPHENPLGALIFTYAIHFLSMFMRPLGALAFGYIGDVYGRQRALTYSYSGMALLSCAIAFIPLHSRVWWVPPVLFCLGRALQNFLASGAMIGGAIFLLERSSKKKQDFCSSLFEVSTMGGILLASASVAFLGHYERVLSGWRYLYVFGCITALFACMMRCRRQCNGTIRGSSPRPLYSFKKVFWEHRNALVLVMVSSGFSYASYSMSLILMNGFVPFVTEWSKAEMMSLNTGLLVLDFFALPFFGWLSAKTSREKVMLTAALSAVITAIPLCLLLEGAALITILSVRVVFVLFGVAFSAPFHAWTQQLVPQKDRYAVLSLGYTLGSQLFGGPTATISLWLFKQTGSIASIAWWWSGLAFVSSIAIIVSCKNKESASCLTDPDKVLQ